MSGIKEIILQKSLLYKNEVIELRRHFHRNPELSFKEFNTGLFIRNYLNENKISFREGIAGTGVIAQINGTGTRKFVIAIRAEMDALPVQEKSIADYASINEGKMHACGHDAHMAMLLGIAKVINEMQDTFGGTVLFIFQPGEERSPGGARLISESGVLNDPRPDIILAHHVLPELETGMIGYKSGNYMASCDEIYITVSGKGGHAALPGLTTDQILIASHLIIELKEIIKKKSSDNQIPTVLGIGRIIGDGATNIIPEKVEIAGTFRTFNEKWRNEGLDIIRSVCEKTASEFGVSVLVKIAEGYPVLVNNEHLTEKAVSLSRHLLGDDKVVIFNEIRMSSDDFSFYSSLASSIYFRVGINKKGNEPKKLHTSEFDIDEESLETGVTNMCWLVLNLLSTGLTE